MSIWQLMLLLAASEVVGPVTLSRASAVILNEYNAVGSDRWLECDEGPPTCDAADTFFGRVQGNGGDWFELVVIDDHVDMRDWKLEWQDALYAGTLTLTDFGLWSDLRSGTIITFTDLLSCQGGLDTDPSYCPAGGDWAININSFDSRYVSTTTNVDGDGPGDFSVTDNDWQLTIRDETGALVFGPAGEGVPNTDPSVSDREVFKLEEDPSASVTPAASSYRNGTASSFGAPNFSDNQMMAQDFDELRAVLSSPEAFVELVTLRKPSDVDALAVLPESEPTFTTGETLYVEAWATTVDPNGFTMVTVNITFDPLRAEALTITHTELFSLWPSGTIDNVQGLLDAVSGTVPTANPACSTHVGASEWVRVAIIEMRVTAFGTFLIESMDACSPVFLIATCGGGGVFGPTVNYGHAFINSAVIPAVSPLGLVVMFLLMLTAGSLVYSRSRSFTCNRAPATFFASKE